MSDKISPAQLLQLLEAIPFKAEKTTFGYSIDLPMPKNCDVIIVGPRRMQFEPRHILLPHQLYVENLPRLAEGESELLIYPANSNGALLITMPNLQQETAE